MARAFAFTSPLEGEVSNAAALLGGGTLKHIETATRPSLTLPLKGGGKNIAGRH